ATIYARALWQRHRKQEPGEKRLTLQDFIQRLDLLVTAAFGAGYPIHVAQPPAPTTFLTKVFKGREGPRVEHAVPATDGLRIWLPAQLPEFGNDNMLDAYRALALQQAMRAERGSATQLPSLSNPLEQAVFLALEAPAAEQELMQRLPGMRQALAQLRSTALAARPPMKSFPDCRRPLEEFVRALMKGEANTPVPQSAGHSADLAREIARDIELRSPGLLRFIFILYKDLWTGELHPPAPARIATGKGDAS